MKRTVLWLAVLALQCHDGEAGDAGTRHLLYVAEPGWFDDLSRGGHGVLVFDIDDGHRFTKRIPFSGQGDGGAPLAVKGICASAASGRLYVSTPETMTSFDLASSSVLWEQRHASDRMAITPDGKSLFTPSYEQSFWQVLDGETGAVTATIPTESIAHNTIVSLDGTLAYLADRGSRMVEVVDTRTDQILRKIGPFGDVVRPIAVNGRSTLLYANVNSLLGFEIADLASGSIVYHVEVPGFTVGPLGPHGCPSHGIGLTPDEREVWLADSTNKRLHIFDNTVLPPVYEQSVEVRDQPSWITFSIDGTYAYPSTGDVLDVATRRVVTTLTDESGGAVQSEKLLEVDLDASGKVVAAGDQFGVGRVRM